MSNKPGKNEFLKEVVISFLIIFVLFIIGITFSKPIINLLIKFPFFNSIYNIFLLEIKRKSIIGLSVITFLGSLFFIGYPGDVFYLFYIRANYNILYVSSIMIFWTMAAQLVNYAIGALIEKKIVDRFVKDKKSHYLKSLKKYDQLLIILFNVLPLPADILSTILGMIKYDVKKALGYALLGRIIKYSVYYSIIVLIRHF